MTESITAVSSQAVERQWADFVAAKTASRREFIARQLSRAPEERLAVMVGLARRAAVLRSRR